LIAAFGERTLFIRDGVVQDEEAAACI
jgi:hypothetical protein